MAEEWGLDLEVAVRVSSRPLSDAERKELVTLLHVGAVGEFDPELLSDWGVDSEELAEWGMDEETLAEILAQVGETVDHDDLWKGMPEYEQEKAGGVQTIKIHFMAREDVVAFAGLIDQPVTEKTKYLWYPKVERKDLLSFECQDES